MSSYYTNSSSQHRFIRLNPRFDRDKTLELLKSELNHHQDGDYSDNIDHTDTEQEYPLPIPWLNSKQHEVEFFAIPYDFSLNKSLSFKSGRVYGMDVTSGAAVAALLFDVYDLDGKKNITSDDDSAADGDRQVKGSSLRVLDLCCAPG